MQNINKWDTKNMHHHNAVPKRPLQPVGALRGIYSTKLVTLRQLGLDNTASSAQNKALQNPIH